MSIHYLYVERHDRDIYEFESKMIVNINPPSHNAQFAQVNSFSTATAT